MAFRLYKAERRMLLERFNTQNPDLFQGLKKGKYMSHTCLYLLSKASAYLSLIRSPL